MDVPRSQSSDEDGEGGWTVSREDTFINPFHTSPIEVLKNMDQRYGDLISSSGSVYTLTPLT